EGRARRVDRRLQERLGAAEVVLPDSHRVAIGHLAPSSRRPGAGRRTAPLCRRAATRLSGRETRRAVSRAASARRGAVSALDPVAGSRDHGRLDLAARASKREARPRALGSDAVAISTAGATRRLARSIAVAYAAVTLAGLVGMEPT